MSDDSGRPAASAFAHGVASGDPLDDRVVIWTRVSGSAGPAEVAWTVARDPGLRDLVASGTALAESAHDWTIHVDVTGLEPGTTYWYGFSSDEVRSPVGRTRTLPTGDVARLRLAMVSCAKYNAGFFNAYRRIAARSELDFVLHLGDYIYEAAQKPPASQTPGADIGRPFDPSHECVTLDDYRRRYAQYRSDPDVQAMHHAHSLIATVDDHELADGAWRNGSIEHDAERDGPWAERRARAFQARWEWLPARLPDPARPERVYRSVGIGSLVDLFLIDTRSARDQPVGGAAMQDPDRSQLGHEQRTWLLDGLDRSRTAWRLLANSSVMSQIWSNRIDAAFRKPLVVVKLIGADADGPDFDQWDGYPAERAAILGHVRDAGIRDLVVLSGDVHVGLALELPVNPLDATSERVAVEFVTSSLTSQNVDDKMGWLPHTGSLPVQEALLAALPYLRWVDLDSHGYVTIDVDPERVRADWWFVETVLARTNAERLGATWTVNRGDPRLVPSAD